MRLTLNPPYPVSRVGFFPLSRYPFLWKTNIGTLVPSFDAYQTWRTSYAEGSMPGVDTLSHSEVFARRVDLVNRGRNGERLESEEEFLAIPPASESLRWNRCREGQHRRELCPQDRKVSTVSWRFFRTPPGSCRPRSPVLQNAVRRGDDLFPVGAGRMGRVHDERVKMWSILVGGDVESFRGISLPCSENPCRW